MCKRFNSVTMKVIAILALATCSAHAQAPIPGAADSCAAPNPLLFPSPPIGIDPQIEWGQPNKFVDGVGWVFGIPRKLILWDRRAVNHRVTSQTEQSLAQYVNDNGVASTKIRINEYDPGGEWHRLVANKKVGAGWRYTFGAFGTLAYTLFPGRLFGADGYNPYTDSIYIYSDLPYIAQERAAYAKLVHERRYPGTYVALTSLPFVRLWPEKQVKDDVLSYAVTHGTAAEQRDAIHTMYPEYGAEVAEEFTQFIPGGFLITAAGAGIGHAAAHFDADEPMSNEELPPSAPWPATETAQARQVVPAAFNR
jgi:hypothetical protein